MQVTLLIYFNIMSKKLNWRKHQLPHWSISAPWHSKCQISTDFRNPFTLGRAQNNNKTPAVLWTWGRVGEERERLGVEKYWVRVQSTYLSSGFSLPYKILHQRPQIKKSIRIKAQPAQGAWVSPWRKAPFRDFSILAVYQVCCWQLSSISPETGL